VFLAYGHVMFLEIDLNVYRQQVIQVLCTVGVEERKEDGL